MYNNGQRPQKMYGGGMAMRKPMMYGGLAEKNKAQGTMTPKTQDSMGMMTDQKKFAMGYKYGGKTGGKPDYLDFDKDGDKKEPMKQALRQKKSGKKTV